MAEWSIAAVLKTVEVNSLPGFESLSLRKSKGKHRSKAAVLFCWPEEASSLANDGRNKSTRATIVAMLSFAFARAFAASDKGMAEPQSRRERRRLNPEGNSEASIPKGMAEPQIPKGMAES